MRTLPWPPAVWAVQYSIFCSAAGAAACSGGVWVAPVVMAAGALAAVEAAWPGRLGGRRGPLAAGGGAGAVPPWGEAGAPAAVAGAAPPPAIGAVTPVSWLP